jgi:uncharacterized protein (TIGR04255 family)
MSSTKLKNAPLKEVIFELHWNSVIDNSGVQSDRGFDLAQGKFAHKINHDFPIHRKLIPDNIPIRIFGAPLHQYWKAESKWPVVQHGQGMLAVNDVELNYEWEKSFKPLVLHIIAELVSSYDELPIFNRLKLQYINAWDVENSNSSNFISENLLTEVKTGYKVSGSPKHFNIFNSYQLPDSSEMQIVISNGINNLNQENSVIWTSTIEKVAKFNVEEIESLLENAHSELSKMFKTMLNPDFYDSLDK